MGRVVELLVGISALAGIATFLGFRTAIRATLRTLGRKPESPPPQEDPRRGLLSRRPKYPDSER